MAIPVFTGARPVSYGRLIIYIASVLPASQKTFALCCPMLLERTVTAFESNSPTDYAKHGSLLFGDMGAALLAMRLAPTSSLADLVHRRAEANIGTADPGAHVGHARVDGGRNPHGRDDTGTAMARSIRNAGGPAVGRSGGHAARPTLDTRSLWCQRPLARARSRLRWQRHPVIARVGLVDASAASAGG